MNEQIISLLIIITIPFLGTVLGSACVFFMEKEMSLIVRKSLLGFASGVMIAASIWSLIIPSMEMSSDIGKWAVIPTAIGFFAGMLFLLSIDRILPHLHLNSNKPEGLIMHLSRTTMLTLAVVIHNFPEGMAVGVVLAGSLQGDVGISIADALAVSIGIAIQNIPEGAIISMPMCAEGNSRKKSFFIGSLSGIVEPIGSILVILLAALIVPIMPYLLAFAAGAMMYVVVEELIPEASEGEHSNHSTIYFALGFILMMALDVVLG